MSDETIIVQGNGTIFLGGPPLVKAATGEEVSAEELGGADVHSRISGVTDHFAVNDKHALAICRNIVTHLNRRKYIPWDIRTPEPPHYDPNELLGIVPRIAVRVMTYTKSLHDWSMAVSFMSLKRCTARPWSVASRI